MIKRVVILQDEHLVVHEIQRNMQRAAATAAAPSAASRVGGLRGSRGSAGSDRLPGGFPSAPEPDPVERAG